MMKTENVFLQDEGFTLESKWAGSPERVFSPKPIGFFPNGSRKRLNSDTVMNDAFWIGLGCGMCREKRDTMIGTVRVFVKGNGTA